jgi:hypothetical protein
MDMLIGLIAGVNATRRLAQSALPGAPTVPERERTPRIPATRRALASGLRRVANRIESRSGAVACP